MASTFFIPKKINVGFQERHDTYTGKLAYVIYFDEKGKLRKEASWKSWKNDKIPTEIYDNEPMTGFVLNKKAGGYDTGWNHRQTYVRVFDPRGFEFEITVPNLLYLLENATSTKGKGLEGEFVYGWSGTDLVLIPCEAPDYKALQELNALRHSDKKIGARDLKIGATYLTRSNEEWVFLGKFPEYTYSWLRQGISGSYGSVLDDKTKAKTKFWFWDRSSSYDPLRIISSASGKFISTVTEECAQDYADLMDTVAKSKRYSPIDESKTVYEPYTAESLQELLSEVKWDTTSENIWVGTTGKQIRLHFRKSTGEYSWETAAPINSARIYNTRYSNTVAHKVKSAEDVIRELNPHARLQYLENGHLYERT